MKGPGHWREDKNKTKTQWQKGKDKKTSHKKEGTNYWYTQYGSQKRYNEGT